MWPIIVAVAGLAMFATSCSRKSEGGADQADASGVLKKFGVSRNALSETERSWGEYIPDSRKLVIIVPEFHNHKSASAEVKRFHAREYATLKQLLNDGVRAVFNEGEETGTRPLDICTTKPLSDGHVPMFLDAGFSAAITFTCINERETEYLGYEDIDGDAQMRTVALQFALYEINVSVNPALKDTPDNMFLLRNVESTRKNLPDKYQEMTRLKDEYKQRYFFHDGPRMMIRTSEVNSEIKRLTDLRSVEGAQNVISVMDRDRIERAVVICGLSHAELIARVLRDNRVSFVVLEQKGTQELKKTFPLIK